MEKEIIIDGGNHRRLSELKDFQNGLPFGVVNKTKPDVGGTYLACNCDYNYIIICPFRDLVDSIAADENNKYPVFKCYGGTRITEFRKYMESNDIKKIAVTWDSFYKLNKWLDNNKDFRLLIDEYHLILEDMDFRYNAITKMMEEINKFDYYTFLSATPISEDFSIDFLNKLPHYKVVWNNLEEIKVFAYNCTKIVTGSAKFIKNFLDEGLILDGIEVERLFVFFNSVKSIEQILRTLDISPDLVKVSCADRIRNHYILKDRYEIEPVTNPNKKLNFFTKKGFQGCNLFTNNGLIVVVSDSTRENTLIDISTTMEQIAGRLRDNDKFHNVFRKYLVHLYNTNNKVETKEEFEAMMDEKRKEAQIFINDWNTFDDTRRKIYLENRDMSKDLVSVINNVMIFNKIKEQSFIYKQKLREKYKGTISIMGSYRESNRFNVTVADDWTDFDIKMKKAVTMSYKQILQDYLEHPNEEYEKEYPDLPIIRKYMKVTEMNSLGWNITKITKRAKDKKFMNDYIFKEIHKVGFISCKDLKAKFAELFKKYDLDIAPKASLIEDNTWYDAQLTTKRIDGKTVKGYEIGGLKFRLVADNFVDTSN